MTKQDDLYSLSELMMKLSHIQELGTGHLNYPKALLTLAFEIVKIQKKQEEIYVNRLYHADWKDVDINQK